MKKQNIEDIFSSIKDYSTPVPPDLWEKIETQLDAPKKKKHSVIKWVLAACLILGLSLGSVLYFSESATTTIIPNNLPVSNENNVVIQEIIEEQNQDSQNILNENNAVIRKIIEEQNQDSQNILNENNNQETNEQQRNSSSNQKVTTNQLSSFSKSKKGNSFTELNSDENPLIPEKNSNNFKKEQIATVKQDKTSKTDSLTQSKIDDELLILEKLKNTLAKTDDNKNANDEPEDKATLENRWSIGAYAGVASSDNFNNRKLLGNKISSQQTSTYGVKTNYKLNKKWAINSGLKLNTLGQSVANVVYYKRLFNDASGSSTNNHIKINEKATYLSTNKNYIFISNNNAKVQKTSNPEPKTTGLINQQLQYLELPLEISYAVLETKKAAIRFNTGGFLGKLISNEISLDGNSIGKNTDVNNFIYGSQLSSTLQYEVVKKTNFFVEPGINYYLNPSQNDSFNQFQWGLNFGVNFNF